MRTQAYQFLILALCLWMGGNPACSQPALDTERPVYMKADKLGYDQKNAIVIAMGNVQVMQGQSTLFADRITYYQRQNLVRANGNVRVEDHLKGETYYAENVQLKESLAQGVIFNFRARLMDNSQFAAREARRLSETRTKLKKAVYSPCEICEDSSPFWQLKASEIDINEQKEKVSYEDVQLEFYGVPVAYAPFFSHPTPDAKAKSGFLMPEYSQNSNLGASLRVPYYIAIAPDKDMTLTPFLTSEEGPVLIGEYRQRTDNGEYEFSGSITNPIERDDFGNQLDNREIRGHIFLRGEERLSEHWRTGFNIQRTTDDTYLRRYGFGSPRSLRSRIFTEGLYGRNFLTIEALTFQGLDFNDDPDREPFVLPLAEGYYETDPGSLGITGLRRFHHASLQAIAREEGPQSRRLVLENGFKLPVRTSGGHLIDTTLNARMDLYSVEDAPRMNQPDFNGEKVRFIPTAAVKWRYPLIRAGNHSSLTIEPTVLAVARPGGVNEAGIPNEDNAIVEFTNANLFDLNPFPGYDTVDSGSRLAYGVSGEWWLGNKSYLDFMVGQNFSVDSDTPFPYNDEANEHFSDYVGRVAFNYDPFAFAYRFRLDQDSLAPNTQSTDFSMDYSPVRLQLNYLSIEDDMFLDDREEILTQLGLQLTDAWSVRANARRDLILNNMLFAGAGLTYQNECFTLDAAFSRAFTRDRDIEPDDTFMLRIALKNLTEL